MHKIKQAAIYCRAAVAQEVGHDQSIAAQILRGKEYAAKKGYIVAKIYIDNPSSGRRIGKSLIILLADAGQGKFQVVITRDEFRISRSPSLFSQTMLTLLKAKMRVAFLNPQPSNQLALRGLMSRLRNSSQAEPKVWQE